MAYHCTMNGLDFNAPPALEINCHGGIARIANSGQIVHGAFHDGSRYPSRCLRYRGGFLHHAAIQRPRGLLGQELRRGQTSQRRETTKGRDEYELFPETTLDIE